MTEELLMEAHEVEEKPIATLVLFAGLQGVPRGRARGRLLGRR